MQLYLQMHARRAPRIRGRRVVAPARMDRGSEIVNVNRANGFARQEIIQQSQHRPWVAISSTDLDFAISEAISSLGYGFSLGLNGLFVVTGHVAGGT